ncbi:DUF3048 domain-containing protein [Candidatus Saccharibacteria bacterium]|nr:MAG: DUF3048 domain-containing protein [Candidatus Saccharibacteria bacterium]
MIDDFIKHPERKQKKPLANQTPMPQYSSEHAPVGSLYRPGQEPSADKHEELPEPQSAFHTPEAIAQAEEQRTTEPSERVEQAVGSMAVAHQDTTAMPGKSKKAFLDWHWRYGRKTTVAIIVVAVVLIGGGIAAAYLNQPKNQGGTTVSKRGVYKPPKPKVIYSTLTGLPVADEGVNQRPVTGVMIENSTDARPQSGMNQAGIVFEAIAEGGITRFLTLYQDSQPDYLGPVRSVRPYYIQWCMGFDCSIAHVGGSPEALQSLKQWGGKDLDQFANSGAYYRISSRYAPHNMYTSMAALNTLETQKGFGASSYTGFARKDDPKQKPAANASSIDFALSGVYFNAHFDYDAASNSYKRSQAGAPHMVVDKAGAQTQLQPKVVVALFMQYSLNGKYSVYNVIGSGQAIIFQDGVATAATWAKTDLKTPLTLTGADGKPLALNRGQTWFTALSDAGKATYK